MSGAVWQPMPGRLATYRVVVADDLTLGFIRLDVSAQQWIARTAGSEKGVACLRRFPEKDDAARWLQEHEPAPVEAERPPYGAPGRRSGGGMSSARPEVSRLLFERRDFWRSQGPKWVRTKRPGGPNKQT